MEKEKTKSITISGTAKDVVATLKRLAKENKGLTIEEYLQLQGKDEVHFC